MPDIVVVGSVALDNVKTPLGEAKGVMGGSAAYFSFAASFFAKVGLVGVVGRDFSSEYINLFKKRNICLQGLEIANGKTFRWEGYYENDMNEAHTIKTELNTFESFRPKLPEEYLKVKYLFLGNIDPELQLNVLSQLSNPGFTALDTMNFWIENKPKELFNVIKKVKVLLLNEWEAKGLFKIPNLVKAARLALNLGLQAIIIKKGGHGALLFTESAHFSAPGYPLEKVVDPTGSGDCFAGGFMGWLAKTDDLSEANMRKAIIYGSVVASFNAEGFGLSELEKISMKDINKRYKEFKKIVDF